MHTQAIQLVEKYYDSFNKGDKEAFFATLDEHVVHDINQGRQETGKKVFRSFMERMDRHYKEQVVELVVFANEKGTRAAAEFFIEGTYLSTDHGLPPANGQRYRLRCGAFFEIRGSHITRVTNYYNLQEWLSQVK